MSMGSDIEEDGWRAWLEWDSRRCWFAALASVLSPGWTSRSWRTRRSLRANVLEQISHANGFSFVCVLQAGGSIGAEEMRAEEMRYLMCLCRCSSRANKRWQCGHGSVFVLVADAFLLTRAPFVDWEASIAKFSSLNY